MTPQKQEAIRYRRELGWNVVAAAPRGKVPIGQWKRWQTERIPERLVRESFPDGTDNNVFVITGSVSGLCVLDCDTPEADAWWRERLGDEVLDATTRVRTDKGSHYYFRLPEGRIERGRSMHDGEIEWDLRAEGGGVVAPPSTHPSGRKYEWTPGRGPEALRDAPDALFERSSGEPAAQARSQLSELLSDPPTEGGRNVWLTKVAGHYALHIPHRDAYETMVRDAAAKLSPPLPEHEIVKMVESIWTTEQAKVGKVAEPIDQDEDWRRPLIEPTEETGWLASGGVRILTQIKKKSDDGERWELGLSQWMDADLRVEAVVEDPDTETKTYIVEVRKASGQVIGAQSLPAKVVADYRRLSEWLLNRGAVIGTPDDIFPRKMVSVARLSRYLEAQKAPKTESVPYLGWHDESAAFLTHDHVIRADGPVPFEAVRPTPAMRDWAKYRYGHDHGDDAARDVLRRVLEFHDETVAAVFSSWWAAAILKPQIQRAVSQFPFMALEAASESGKTTGFFNLMMQLSGHYGGQVNPTPAALRDALSANRSGIVWVDDLDDLERHGELLRNVTVGGSVVKKGEDNSRQIVAQMRAALVISGEGLGLHGQKALMDRAVLLNVPSPVGRLNRSGGPQWEDILELQRQYPDLTTLAGSIIELALSEVDLIRDIKSLRKGSGRFADKNAIIRLGARIVAGMTQENWVVELADEWALGQTDHGSENALTMSIIPEVLRSTGFKKNPEGPDEQRRMTATPAFVRDGTVWFSPTLLADWLARNRRNGSGVRLETKQALEDQARALGLGGTKGVDRKNFRYVMGDGRSIYWRCTDELSQLVIDRAEGLGDGEEREAESEPHADRIVFRAGHV